MGSVVNQAQFEIIQGYIRFGWDEGATLMTGGQIPENLGEGYFIEPTVFADVRPEMRITREEIFGPVAAVIPFADDDEAVRIANDTIYGLAAAVWTKALRMAQRIKRGTLWINTYQVLSPTLPFGGYKQSGIGRELGHHALEQYQETKSVICNLNDRPMTLTLFRFRLTLRFPKIADQSWGDPTIVGGTSGLPTHFGIVGQIQFFLKWE